MQKGGGNPTELTGKRGTPVQTKGGKLQPTLINERREAFTGGRRHPSYEKRRRTADSPSGSERPN